MTKELARRTRDWHDAYVEDVLDRLRHLPAKSRGCGQWYDEDEEDRGQTVVHS